MKFEWKKGTPILWEEFTWEEVEEYERRKYND